MFSKSFLKNIAANVYPNIKSWWKIGYTPTLNSTESDIWSYAGLYGNSGLFPAAAVQMEIKEIAGGENTNDIGTIIRGSRSVPITSDAGGSTTTLLDADIDFGADGGTAVVAGDILLLDPSGTVSPNIPEWGYITTVATHQLTCSKGFSLGGTGTTRKYLVISSAKTGALVMKIDYLTNTYLEKTLLIPTNGTTAVLTLNDAGAALSDLYRINSFRMVAAGSTAKTAESWLLQTVGGGAGTIWSYITKGYTRARNTIYTVPANKTLYITEWNVGWAVPNANKIQSARLFLRANFEPSTLFNTGNIFYPYFEQIISNEETSIEYEIETLFPQKTDIKVSGIGFTAGAPGTGAAASVIRGFIVS